MDREPGEQPPDHRPVRLGGRPADEHAGQRDERDERDERREARQSRKRLGEPDRQEREGRDEEARAGRDAAVGQVQRLFSVKKLSETAMQTIASARKRRASSSRPTPARTSTGERTSTPPLPMKTSWIPSRVGVAIPKKPDPCSGNWSVTYRYDRRQGARNAPPW